MGVSPFHVSKSSYDKVSTPATCNCNMSIKSDFVDIRNPDPNNYTIKKTEQIREYLIVFINYPNCFNYEGNKILVYKHTRINYLINQKSIDPHFSNNKKYISPIARFEPTNDGWLMAVKLCNAMTYKA